MNSSVALLVKYRGPTDFEGSGTMIIEAYQKHIVADLAYDYEFNSSLDQALDWMEKKGMKVITVGEGCGGFIVMVTKESYYDI